MAICICILSNKMNLYIKTIYNNWGSVHNESIIINKTEEPSVQATKNHYMYSKGPKGTKLD